MEYIFDWEADGDRFSFEDSDRFEEDSLCSWMSETESFCNNWRGWRKQNGGSGGANGSGNSGAIASVSTGSSTSSNDGQLMSLVELSAQAVARSLPFEVVEHFYPPIPEQLQLRIAFWSFPENEEDIRLYSCLANGSSDEFQKGESLFRNKSVHDALQIGFHLSATVTPPLNLPQSQGKGSLNVALVFDRRHITSCTCSCTSHLNTASWCAHVVALCLFRIHQSSQVCLRAPVSESLSRLERDQLQKFAQYLISELPQQILPTAQRLLDELLSSQQTTINMICGAPDPTAGPSAGEQTTWCLDEATLHDNIKKTLVKFCVPSPVVLSDVNYLSNNPPPAANEWQSLLRPLRGREPEGIWNLLLIVREMFRRSDNNAIPLLEILTEEILACEQIVIWWFNNKTQNHNCLYNSRNGNQSSTSSSQNAASSLCDEIVTLWRLAALNPVLSNAQRSGLCSQFKDWHIITVEKLRKSRSSTGINHSSQLSLKTSDIDLFTGFKPAIEACQLEWNDYLSSRVFKHSGSWMSSLNKLRSEGESNNHMAHAKGYGKSPVSCTVNVTDGVGLMHGPGLMWAMSEGANRGRRKGLCSSGSEGFGESKKRPAIDANDRASTSTVVVANAAAEEKEKPTSTKDCQQKSGDTEDVDSDCGSLPSTPGFQNMKVSSSKSEQQAPSSSCDADAMATQHSTASSSAAPLSLSEDKLNRNAIPVNLPNRLPSSTTTSHVMPDVLVVARSHDGSSAAATLERSKLEEPNYFDGVRKPENKQEIMFALAEALHAHGHAKEACRLSRELAEEMLNSSPDVAIIEHSAVKVEKKKKVQTYNSIPLYNASFLCSVLLDEEKCRHLAFRVGLFGLEMARAPAANKSLEVKLAHQEYELVTQLKKIPLGPDELNIIRDRAEKLRDGKLKSRGEALLPIMLASFIFDSLCLPATKSATGQLVGRQSISQADEKLGFEAAVAALGLKANVSEAEHPLLCEGTRRQKGELAVTMLVHYKDDPSKLDRIMNKLLDKEVHQLYKNPSSSGSVASVNSGASNALLASTVVDAEPASVATDATKSGGGGSVSRNEDATTSEKNVTSSREDATATSLMNNGKCSDGGSNVLSASSLSTERTKMHLTSASKDTDSSALEEDIEGSSDYKAWEAKFRCANLKTTKKPSVGMASIDSSAPETTSSDNSPTLIRRNTVGHHSLIHQGGPGSDSGSSHKSSDSAASSGCGFQGVVKNRDNDSPPNANDLCNMIQPAFLYSRSSTPNVKGIRYKGRNRMMPVVPNQPSEASAHFMFELAKTVLVKAGGSSSTAMFVSQSAANNTNVAGPHRALHLCAFKIGLYALGLNNCVTPNWLSRTYSSHVSWITGQATEIGYPAINILIKTWEGHLTPQEVASLSDRAARCRDANMVRAAAELALSCLPHAQALNPNEIQRALIQCKEQSNEMLQRACLSVEMAAKEGGVYPEVLFEVAKRWYELYEEMLHGPSQHHSSVASNDRTTNAQSTAPRTADGSNIPRVHVVSGQSAPALINPGPMVSPAALCAQGSIGTYTTGGPMPMMPPMSYTIPGQQIQVLHPFLAPYAYVQPLTPPNFGHYYSIPHSHPVHMNRFPYSGQSPYLPSNMTPPSTLFHPGMQNVCPPPIPLSFVSSSASSCSSGNQQQTAGIPNWAHPPAPYALLQPVDGHQALPPSSQQQQQLGMQPIVAAPPPVPVDMALPGSIQINYLLAAYRVGMLAMETLARRVHDDRPQVKYARNPPYGEDVKWLHGIAMKLGTSYLQQFCASTINTIISPFILLDIAMESANFLSGNNVTQVPQQLRLPMVSSLLQKCLQMFIQCTHTRIHHITQADYDEFVSIVCSARNAFCMTPDGNAQFQEMLQGLRRQKSCKRDLWQRIINALHSTSNI